MLNICLYSIKNEFLHLYSFSHLNTCSSQKLTLYIISYSTFIEWLRFKEKIKKGQTLVSSLLSPLTENLYWADANFITEKYVGIVIYFVRNYIRHNKCECHCQFPRNRCSCNEYSRNKNTDLIMGRNMVIITLYFFLVHFARNTLRNHCYHINLWFQKNFFHAPTASHYLSTVSYTSVHILYPHNDDRSIFSSLMGRAQTSETSG